MNIEQLRYFSEIARLGSLNKAAEAMYTTHQNLSASIKKLEKELGVEVFKRTNTGMVLTAFGNELLPHAQSVLSLVDKIPSKTLGESFKPIPRLSVARNEMRYVTWVVGQMYNAHKDEGIQIDYHDVSPSEALSLISSGTVDIGYYTMLDYRKNYQTSILQSQGIEFIPLVKSPVIVTVGRKNPLFAREEDWVTLDMIKDFSIIYSFSDYPNSLQKHLGITKKRSFINCRTMAGRTDLISSTDIISVSATPISACRKTTYYDDKRMFRLKDSNIFCDHGYIKRMDTPLTPLAQEFAERLKELLTD